MTIQIAHSAKYGHKYVFRYSAGYEDEIMDEMMRLAQDATTSLDWLDAAQLSFEITQRVAGAWSATHRSCASPPLGLARRGQR